MVLKPDTVKDVLPGWQVFDQRLGGEVALRQSVDAYRAVDHVEAVGGRHVHQHARGPIRPRPDHPRIGRHVARLDAITDPRPLTPPPPITLTAPPDPPSRH